MANNNRKNQNKVSANNTNTNNVKVENKTEEKKTVNIPNQQNSEEKNTANSNRKTQQGTQNDTVAALWELVKKYKRYLAAGVLFIVMLVILVKCTGPVMDSGDAPVAEEQTVENSVEEEFQVDAIPEVNELIQTYYTAYAAGDVATIEKVAQPISETEKSYISLFSEYVEAYENISCYTKTGLKDGEYVVSVYLDMKFKDVATAAPGLDFFYLRTDESGKLYIDNAYSQFNQSNMEKSTQADVQALINEFEQAEDVLALQSEVQKKYEAAVAGDAALGKMANEQIPAAIATWVQSLTQAEDVAQETEDQTASDAQQSGEEKTDESASDSTEASDDEKKDDEKKDDDTKKESDGKAKTAYTIDGINMRKDPSTDESIIIQIAVGEKLKMYPDTEKDGWIKVTYDGNDGYVKREYLTVKKSKVPSTTEEEETPAIALEEGKTITLSESVNVRVSMSETADKVGLAYQGDTVKVIQSYAEGWTKVEWKDQTGYIKTELIK